MPDDDDKPYVTAAEALGIGRDQPAPTPGLSVTTDLVEVPDSPVPGAGHSHVMGPQQAAADPVLAGLDTQHNPLSRAENRAITKPDGETVAPPSDREAQNTPGPTGATDGSSDADAAQVSAAVDPGKVRRPARSTPAASAE